MTHNITTHRAQGKNRKRNATLLLAALALVLILGSCAPGGNVLSTGSDLTADPERAADPAGFWMGLWHGLIAPITFIVSLFTNDVNLYEVYNVGGWYNFGFIIGLSASLGGSGSGAGHARAHSRKKKRDEQFYDDGSEPREL